MSSASFPDRTAIEVLVFAWSEISKRIEAGDILWDGEVRGDSLLLRLGAPLQPLLATTGSGIVDLSCQRSIDELYGVAQPYWTDHLLMPGQMALCLVDERLRLNGNVAAIISTLSHLARVGLGTHVTSPWVMPGWDGHLTLELHNLSSVPLRVYRGMPVARLVVVGVRGSCALAAPHSFYGTRDQLGSRYVEEFSAHIYRR